MFRSHGVTKENLMNKSEGDWYYEMHSLGYNYRMTDIQAALGISQLKKLDAFVERRRRVAKAYNKVFKDNPYFDIPQERNYAGSSYHLYPIRIMDPYKNRKKEIFAMLKAKKLGVQVHYIPIYLQPYYQGLGYRKGLCPKAEDFYKRELSIPLYPALSDEEVEYVVKTISNVFNTLQEDVH